MIDYEPELAVIGCLLLDTSLCDMVFPRLPAKCFADDTTRRVFAMIRTQHKSGASDVVSLFGQADEEAKVLMARCMETVVTTSNIDAYISLVINNYRKRRISSACMEIAMQADSPGTQANDLTGMLRAQLSEQEKIERAQLDSSTKEFSDAAVEYIENLYGDKLTGYYPGYSRLGSMLGGFIPSSFYILAGRSGMGKTDFALNLAVNFAQKGVRTLYLSMEMTRVQLFDRLASRLTQTNSTKIRDRSLDENERLMISNTLAKLCDDKTPLYTDEGQRLSCDDVEAKIIKWQPQVLVVDHVGLMRGDGKKQRWESQLEISQTLKALALKYNIVVLALAQQTSDVEKRSDKKANMSDIKGTDGYSNDADAVMFVSADLYDKDVEWIDATIQIVKNRNGRCGSIQYRWKPQYHTYMEAIG